MKIYTLALLLLSSPLIATEAASDPVYLGTSSSDSQADVSILLINSSTANTGSTQCYIKWIFPSSKGTKVPSIFVVKPGKYDFTSSYTARNREGVIMSSYTFKGGKKYKVDCKGKSMRSLKFTAEEIE
jgi:hypothetical protein